MAIWVLRYGHRRLRDARASTHVALAARALGAAGIIFEGEKDDALMERLGKISKEWGGAFEVRHTDDWMKEVQKFKEDGGWVAHLTMYGEELPKVIVEVRKRKKDGLVIVGSQKVPAEAYQLADFNITQAAVQDEAELVIHALFEAEVAENLLVGHAECWVDLLDVLQFLRVNLTVIKSIHNILAAAVCILARFRRGREPEGPVFNLPLLNLHLLLHGLRVLRERVQQLAGVRVQRAGGVEHCALFDIPCAFLTHNRLIRPPNITAGVQ